MFHNGYDEAQVSVYCFPSPGRVAPSSQSVKNVASPAPTLPQRRCVLDRPGLSPCQHTLLCLSLWVPDGSLSTASLRVVVCVCVCSVSHSAGVCINKLFSNRLNTFCSSPFPLQQHLRYWLGLKFQNGGEEVKDT